MKTALLPVAAVILTLSAGSAAPQTPGLNPDRGGLTTDSRRPFGTLREQAGMQQEWL